MKNKLILVWLLFAGIPSLAWSADSVNGMAGNNYLNDNASRLWQANVCYTTDGSGNVTPIGATAPSGSATSALQTSGNSTLSSILSAVQGVLSVKPSINPAGSVSNNAAITTSAATFTAPAHAVGFLLQAESGNTDSVRWAVGSTATSSVGTLAEPGRDTGYIPMGANISVIAISGTQSVSVQWVLNQ